jgi:hypothetical protein
MPLTVNFLTLKRFLQYICSAILTLLCFNPLIAQLNDLRFDDFNYIDDVQSVEFYQSGDQLSDPVLRLKDSGTLTLSFDILGDIAYTFDYTIIHCNRDWTPSVMRPQEYIDGFADDRLTQFAFSLNTLTPYIHYSLTFPGSQLKPKLSGNYLLVVYRGNMKRENLVLSRRFLVVDAIIPIQASVAQNTPDVGYLDQHSGKVLWHCPRSFQHRHFSEQQKR